MTPPRWIRLDSLDSTSLYARREIEASKLTAAGGPAAIVAIEQHGGIGRFGRPWSSPRGGLWCTLAVPLDGDTTSLLDGLGLRIGLACLDAVREAVSAEVRDRVRLKWPNDLLLDDRKIAGVLSEVVRGPERRTWLLIGFGLNANFSANELPTTVRSSATTLAAHGIRTDVDALAAALAARLLAITESPGPGAGELKRARAELGAARMQPLSMPNGVKEPATLIELDQIGRALFRTADGRVVARTAGPVMEPQAEGIGQIMQPPGSKPGGCENH